MKNSQILALLILLATGHGAHAAWIGYNNPHNQMFEGNDQLQFRDDSFLEKEERIVNTFGFSKQKKYGNSGYSFQEYINQKNEGEYAFLIRAIRANNIKNVEILIELGADVNQQSDRGMSCLHWAARFNFVELIQLLVAAGIDVNLQNNCEETALHIAAQRNAVEMMILLLAAGAEINKQNYFGETVLHIASQWKKIETVQLLLDAGADTEIRNKRGYTAEESITHNDIITLK